MCRDEEIEKNTRGHREGGDEKGKWKERKTNFCFVTTVCNVG